MTNLDRLESVITNDRPIRMVEDNIYSLIPEATTAKQYDNKAGLYDSIVGTFLYNRVMWGDSPAAYRAFARLAIESDPDGYILDAGCGSMLFTAAAHAACGRLVIACDQSMDMLRRARKRLIDVSGSMPENVILLQADLSDLPFRGHGFQTILCMNVLHHYSDAKALVTKFRSLLNHGGHLYMTSLLSNNRFVGDQYLNVLYKKRWIVTPTSYESLSGLLGDVLGSDLKLSITGNMAYITAAPTC